MKKSTMLKDTLSLFLITLVSGALLGTAYHITNPIIEAKQAAKKLEAYAAVYPDAAGVRESEALTAAVAGAEDFFAENEISGAYVTEALEAIDDKGEVIGYAMNFGATKGFGGAIDMSLGIDKNGVIQGLSILVNNETQGFGSKASEPEFLDQFPGVKGPQIKAVSGKSAENEIDGISGATVTTKAVTGGINGALAFIYANGEISE